MYSEHVDCYNSVNLELVIKKNLIFRIYKRTLYKTIYLIYTKLLVHANIS